MVAPTNLEGFLEGEFQSCFAAAFEGIDTTALPQVKRDCRRFFMAGAVTTLNKLLNDGDYAAVSRLQTELDDFVQLINAEEA